jgi:hypothetical protein
MLAQLQSIMVTIAKPIPVRRRIMSVTKKFLRFASRQFSLRGLFRLTAMASVVLIISLLRDDAEVVASTASGKTYSLFSGRARVSLPNTAGAPRKLSRNLYLVRPKNKSQKFAVYVSSEPLGTDERRMSRAALGDSIKRLLEGQGYTVNSFESSGRDYLAELSTYQNLPWQTVGTTPARVRAKFTRTTDARLIGIILACDPSQWDGAAITGFKRSVSRFKATPR